MIDTDEARIRIKQAWTMELGQLATQLCDEVDRLRKEAENTPGSGECSECGSSDWLCYACGWEGGTDHPDEEDDIGEALDGLLFKAVGDGKKEVDSP